MKKKQVILLTIILLLCVIIISMIVNQNKNIKKEAVIIKEMNERAQITDLNNQINALNAEHSEYMNYIETCKTQIATALTNEGVSTSNKATLETMAENISKIQSKGTIYQNTSNAVENSWNLTGLTTNKEYHAIIFGTSNSNSYYGGIDEHSIWIQNGTISKYNFNLNQYVVEHSGGTSFLDYANFDFIANSSEVTIYARMNGKNSEVKFFQMLVVLE